MNVMRFFLLQHIAFRRNTMESDSIIDVIYNTMDVYLKYKHTDLQNEKEEAG